MMDHRFCAILLGSMFCQPLLAQEVIETPIAHEDVLQETAEFHLACELIGNPLVTAGEVVRPVTVLPEVPIPTPLPENEGQSAGSVEETESAGDCCLQPGKPLWNAVLDLVRQAAISDARADAAAEVLQAREALFDLQLANLEKELLLVKKQSEQEVKELKELLERERKQTSKPRKRRGGKTDGPQDPHTKKRPTNI